MIGFLKTVWMLACFCVALPLLVLAKGLEFVAVLIAMIGGFN
jgi:hypothetical protein